MAPRGRQMRRWERLQESFARTKPGGWIAVNVANPVDQRLLRWSNGRVGLLVGQPVGLLETVGAKSGQPRSTPLLYLADGDRIIVVASKAGASRHPAWYHNVKAHPRVEFLPRGGPKGSYVARVAEGAEREELWRAVTVAGGQRPLRGLRRLPGANRWPQDPRRRARSGRELCGLTQRCWAG